MNAAQIKAVVATMVDSIIMSEMRRGKLGVMVNGKYKCIDVQGYGFCEKALREFVARQI